MFEECFIGISVHAASLVYLRDDNSRIHRIDPDALCSHFEGAAASKLIDRRL
jgi:hypothetical protein